MAKSLFYLILFYFLIWIYYTRKEYKEVLHNNAAYHSHMLGYHKVILYDKCGKVVHRPCSSCISSVQNQIGTLSSFFC